MYIFDRSLSGSHYEQRNGFSGVSVSLGGFSEIDPEPLKAQRELVRRRDELMGARRMLEEKEAQGLRQSAALRHFRCPPRDHAEIEKALQISILKDAPRAALQSALRMTVPWLHNAASNLQVSPRAPHVHTAFRRAFGTTPEFVPAWRTPKDKWVDRGDLVAMRLRGVARILTGGSIQFFCWGKPSYCPECKTEPPTYFACSSFGKRYVICLGRLFWENWNQRNTEDNAITLLHEALHIFFGRLIGHEKKGPYGNAYCYERYVLEVNRQKVPPFLDGLCPPKP
jgi:hypothetical protein